MTEQLEIPDSDIRDWARATGRPVGVKGRVSAELRREFERVNNEANAEPPAAAVDSPAPVAVPGDPVPPAGAAAAAGPRAAERPPAGPGPARDETPPAADRSTASRLRARVWGPRGKKRPGARRPRSRARRGVKDRVSIERVTTRLWESGARLVQPMNLPIARCLEWQAPTAGAMLDGAVKDTVLDPAMQVLARWEHRLGDIAALVGTPMIVGALQLPPNQPFRIELVANPQDGTVQRIQTPYPLGAIRHQLLLGMLRECLEANAEAQARLPAEVKQRQLEREQRRADLDEIIGMFFAPPPGPGDQAAAAAEEAAMQAARERLRGA